MKIFISYRRQDSEWVTLSIYNELLQHLKEYHIFKDFNTIKPSEDFTIAIENNLKECVVLLVIIGKQWLDIQDSEGNQRIFNENDFVRMEIASALKLNKIIIPVLVDGALMPNEVSLPENLKDLHKKQSVTISNTNFETDVFKLANAIKEVTESKDKFSQLVVDVVQGNISENDLQIPNGHNVFLTSTAMMGILILLAGYKDSLLLTLGIVLIVICGGIAFFSKNIKSLWLDKQFEKASSLSSKIKIASLILSVIGAICFFLLWHESSPNPMVHNEALEISNADTSTYYKTQNNYTYIYDQPKEEERSLKFLYPETRISILEKKYGFAYVKWQNPDESEDKGWVIFSELVKEK